MIRAGDTNDRAAPPQRPEEVIERLQAHRRELDELGVEHIQLFGSVARGALEAGSDIDMIVAFSQTTYRRFVALKAFLESILGRRVDLLTPPAVQGRFKEQIERDLINVPR